MIKYNTFDEFYNEYKDWSKKDLLKRIYDTILNNKKEKELQERINKAIEYIENNWIEYSDFQYVDNDDELNIDCESIKELLDILKGSDTNGNR